MFPSTLIFIKVCIQKKSAEKIVLEHKIVNAVNIPSEVQKETRA